MNQDEIIRRLSLGEGFGNIPPERIDTHISTIFLIGHDAYKLKHAVATSYLDYSRLENRHRLCQAEFDINRRTAPQIYLGVVPVRMTSEGELILGDGPGEPVEWLVHMRRFPQEALFDHMAQEGSLTPEIMIALADEIAGFHKRAKTTGDDHASRRIAAVMDENDTELSKYASGAIDQRMADAFNQRCRAQFEKQLNRMDRRGEAGFVRHCHGDLHLRNICLIDGRPTLFDAIEFNDNISHIDVLFDLAFLLMDLEHRSLRRQANKLFNRYLYRTEDIGDLALLPLYLALRAGIRAHTTAMAAELANHETSKEQLRHDAAGYLQLGLRLTDTDTPSIMAVGGLSGVGKSTVASEIAPFIGRAPGALILSSDLIRKRLMGVEPLTRLGEAAYSKDTDEAVYGKMMEIAARALADGQSVILDATFQDATRRQEVESIGRMAGLRFDGIWLNASSKQLHERVDGRLNDPSDATSSVLARQLTNDVGEITWHQIDADRPVEIVIESVRGALPEIQRANKGE